MLDWIFVSYLLFLMPGWQLWKSLKKKDATAKPRDDSGSARLFRNLRFILTPLLVLAVLMAVTGRSAALLGLDIPVSIRGQWGLLAVVVLMSVPFIWSAISDRKKEQAKKDKEFAELEALDAIPRTSRELWGFVLVVFCMGIGWELLYRGYLMLVLPPVTGTTGAVILTALAYGIGHGYKSRNQFIGSIVSAFLFTLAYVFTGSLWWLMLLHVCLPLYGVVTGYVMLKKRAALQLAA
jgi:membrane protease YdiL (CAAX protease family)